MVTDGNCFVAALGSARRLAAEGHRALVCHGRPLGRGGDAAGMRYWHAWAEVKLDGEWTVVDESNSLRVVMRRADYYRLGRLPAPGDHVRRFSLDEARRQMATHDHYGPWVSKAEFDREWRERPV